MRKREDSIRDTAPEVLTDPYAGGGRPRDEPPPSSEAPPSSEVPSSVGAPLASPVAHGRGLPAPARPRKRRRRLLRARKVLRFLAFTALAVGVLGGAGFAAWRYGLPLLQEQRSASVFPMGDVGFLPPDFAVLQRWEDLETPGVTALEEARWSYLGASLCGGTDLFRALTQSDRPFGREQVADFLSTPRATRDGLRCGRAFAGATDARVFVVHLASPTKVPSPDAEASEIDLVTAEGIVLVESSLDVAPPSHRHFRAADESLGLGEVRCALPAELGLPRCVDGSPASAHLEASPFWIGASLGAVKRLGRGASMTTGNDHPDADALRLLAERAPRAKRMTLGRGGHFNVDYLALLGLPEAPREPLEALRRTLAEKPSWFAESDDSSYAGGAYVLTLLFESSEDALTAEELLRVVHARAAEALARPSSRDVEPLAARFDEAQHEAAKRAVRAAEVTRDERWLTARYDLTHEDDERETVEAWRARYEERRRAAAAIVRRVHDGDPIPNELYVAAGGTELLAAVKGARGR